MAVMNKKRRRELYTALGILVGIVLIMALLSLLA